MSEDQQLLREYIENGSDHAFGELVSRHIDVVYAAALRVGSGDSHLAEDITQMVFTDLARKARKLPRNVVLAAWLYRHSYFTACKAVRGERRRKTREQVAVEMSAVGPESEASWQEIAPLLDEAMNELGATDQEALVLRYFQKSDFRSIGATLGISEDTAQKRVSRALEKLQLLLKKRGAVVATGALAAMVATEATIAVPAGLATSIAGASVVSAAAGSSFGLNLANYIAASKLKAALILATVVASLVTPYLIQRRDLAAERRENARLQAQALELETLRTENKRLSTVEVRAEELNRMRKEHAELLGLRGQAALARTLADELAKLKSSKPSPARQALTGPVIPASSLKDSGLETPEAAATTLFWAMNTGNAKRFKEALDTEKFMEVLHELRKKADPDFDPKEEHDDSFSLNDFKCTGQLQSVRFLSKTSPAPDEAEFEIAATGADGSTETKPFKFRRTGNEWKFDILAAADPDSFNFTETQPQPDGSQITNNIKVAVQEERVFKVVPTEEQKVR